MTLTTRKRKASLVSLSLDPEFRIEKNSAAQFVEATLSTDRYDRIAKLLLGIYGYYTLECNQGMFAPISRARLRRLHVFLDRRELPCPGCLAKPVITDIDFAECEIQSVPMCSACEAIAAEE